MQVKVVPFNKYHGSLEDFTVLLNNTIVLHNYTKNFKMVENTYNSDIVFYFELEDEDKQTSQELFVTGYHTNFETLTSEVNLRIADAEANNKLIKHINILTLKGSPRILGALIVETDNKVKVVIDAGKKKRRTKNKDEETVIETEGDTVN